MSKRVAVSIEAAFVLFLVAALVALTILRRVPNVTSDIVTLVLFIPALASLLLAVCASWVEPLLPEPRIYFVNTVTFPIVHCALMLAIVRVTATTSEALETLPTRMAPAAMWEHWQVLAMCLLFGFAILNIISLVRKAH